MDKKKWLSKEDFDYVFTRVPRLGVDLAVLTKRGIVLTRRSIIPYKGMWHTPGGSVYMGETLEKAIHRIALNEIGVKVKIGQMLGINEILREGNTGHHTVSVVFKVAPLSMDFHGDEQSDEIKIFSKYPQNMIPHQLKFMSVHLKLS